MTHVLLLGLTLHVSDALTEDAQPLPRYLDPKQVLQVLHDAAVPLASCLQVTPPQQETWTQPFSMTVGGDGKVSTIDWSSQDESAPRRACLQAVLTGLEFSSHDEDREVFRYTLVWKDDAVQAYPTITRAERPQSPLFLYLPPQPAEASWPAWLGLPPQTAGVEPSP